MVNVSTIYESELPVLYTASRILSMSLLPMSDGRAADHLKTLGVNVGISVNAGLLTGSRC